MFKIIERLNRFVSNTVSKRRVQNLKTLRMIEWPNNLIPYKLEVTIVFEPNVILNLTIYLILTKVIFNEHSE